MSGIRLCLSCLNKKKKDKQMNAASLDRVRILLHLLHTHPYSCVTFNET